MRSRRRRGGLKKRDSLCPSFSGSFEKIDRGSTGIRVRNEGSVFQFEADSIAVWFLAESDRHRKIARLTGFEDRRLDWHFNRFGEAARRLASSDHGDDILHRLETLVGYPPADRNPIVFQHIPDFIKGKRTNTLFGFRDENLQIPIVHREESLGQIRYREHDNGNKEQSGEDTPTNSPVIPLWRRTPRP